MKKHNLFIGFVASAMIALCVGCTPSVGDSTTGIPTSEQLSAVESELGNDIRDLKFSLDGKVYEYPVSVSDMTANGWYLDTESMGGITTIPANSVTSNYVALKKNKENGYPITYCNVKFENKSSAEIQVEDGEINEFIIRRDKGATLILPNNITWDSTFEEVVDAYGITDDENFDSTDLPRIIIQDKNSDTRLVIEFSSSTRKIKELKFTNNIA